MYLSGEEDEDSDLQKKNKKKKKQSDGYVEALYCFDNMYEVPENGWEDAIDEESPYYCEHRGLVSTFVGEANMGAPMPSLAKYVEGMVDESAQRVWALKVGETSGEW